jgi:organic radical activating enzyme
MYNYFFDKEISVDTINELVDRLQDRKGKINLHFSTGGGDPDAMYFLIEFLNTRKKDIEITLTNWLMSAGTYLLTDFKGKINISNKLDFLLFHFADRESYNLRKGIIDDKILAEQDLEDNKIFAKKLKKKGLLTDKQLEKYLDGRDVLVYQKQFRTWKL